MSAVDAPAPIRSTIPARLDRLGWSPFHTRMVAGLGAAWILDRLQMYIAYVVGGAIMIVGGIVELAIGIKAEGKSLEDITTPITSTSADPGGTAEPPSPPLALA